MRFLKVITWHYLESKFVGDEVVDISASYVPVLLNGFCIDLSPFYDVKVPMCSVCDEAMPWIHDLSWFCTNYYVLVCSEILMLYVTRCIHFLHFNRLLQLRCATVFFQQYIVIMQQPILTISSCETSSSNMN